MSEITLNYFNPRGHVEIDLWVLAAAGVDFKDNWFSKEAWPKFKSQSPTEKCPWMEVDGVKIAQSTAIARHLARKHGLAGGSAVEEARVDMVAAVYGDMLGVILPLLTEQDADRKEKLRSVAEKEKMPEFLEMLEKVLLSNGGGGGYFVGNSITWCDMQIVIGLEHLELLQLPHLVEGYPKMAALKRRVQANPGIAAWIQRRPSH